MTLRITVNGEPRRVSSARIQRFISRIDNSPSHGVRHTRPQKCQW